MLDVRSTQYVLIVKRHVHLLESKFYLDFILTLSKFHPSEVRIQLECNKEKLRSIEISQ